MKVAYGSAPHGVRRALAALFRATRRADIQKNSIFPLAEPGLGNQSGESSPHSKEVTNSFSPGTPGGRLVISVSRSLKGCNSTAQGENLGHGKERDTQIFQLFSEKRPGRGFPTRP